MANQMFIQIVLITIIFQTVASSQNKVTESLIDHNTIDEETCRSLCESDSKRCNCLTREPTMKTNKQPLVRFNTNGTLKIVQFTDLHYGQFPDSRGPEDDFNSTRVMRDVLELENPDFVIFTGDMVTGDDMFPNVTEYIHMLLKPVVEKKYKWATVYGNHDTAVNVSRLEILQAEQSYGDQCYTRPTDLNLPGVTNYYIPIYGLENSSASAEERPLMLWWFFDSRGGRGPEGEPEYVHSDVVEWFKNENTRMKSKWGQLPALVFVHIPPAAYVDVQQRISANALCSGLVDDNVTPQRKDTGFMDALLAAGGVRTMFVGHDHGNSWCCFYRNMEICYNRHTGYGGYGNWTRGARVIGLDIENLGNQTNYVRLENGTITDEFPKT